MFTKLCSRYNAGKDFAVMFYYNKQDKDNVHINCSNVDYQKQFNDYFNDNKINYQHMISINLKRKNILGLINQFLSYYNYKEINELKYLSTTYETGIYVLDKAEDKWFASINLDELLGNEYLEFDELITLSFNKEHKSKTKKEAINALNSYLEENHNSYYKQLTKENKIISFR